MGLTKALALEVAEYGITVNTINPGWVETELSENAIEQSDFSYQEELDMIPQKRFIQPYEIAELVKFLDLYDCSKSTGSISSSLTASTELTSPLSSLIIPLSGADILLPRICLPHQGLP